MPSQQLSPPNLKGHGQFRVLTDDLISGGTKRRVLMNLIEAIIDEGIVYSACEYDEESIALSHADADMHKKVMPCHLRYEMLSNNFYNATKEFSSNYIICRSMPKQMEAEHLAREYADRQRAYFMPIGFRSEAFKNELVEFIQASGFLPVQVWAMASSEMLVKIPQLVW